MVVRESELRQPVIVRACLLALVDRRIEIDEMPPGLAGRLHDDLYVALAVECAGVAASRVVVHDGVDVRRLAPANSLEMNSEGGSDRPARHVEWKGGRSDPEASLFGS